MPRIIRIQGKQQNVAKNINCFAIIYLLIFLELDFSTSDNGLRPMKSYEILSKNFIIFNPYA